MSECIEWTGRMYPGGYGMAYSPGRKRGTTAHRVAYEKQHGMRVPDDMEVDHLCRNRACVNVEHLEMVTPSENHRRGAAARPNYRCGHPRTPENTYSSSGANECRTCLLERLRRYRETHKEEKRAYNRAYYLANRDRLLAEEKARYRAKAGAS